MPRTEVAREADKQRSREWYLANKSRVKARLRRNKTIVDAARSKPCLDCGIQYPLPAMELDHVRGDKFKPVTQMYGYSEARIRAEIDKCEVRCANCHAIKTEVERPWQGQPAI